MLFIALLLFCTPLEVSSKRKLRKYNELEYISGVSETIPIYIHQKSLNIDLARTRDLRFAIDLRDYYELVGRFNSFTIKVYDLNYGGRDLINQSHIKIHKPKAHFKKFNLELDNYKHDIRQMEVDLLDHNSNLVNTYKLNIEPINLALESDTSATPIVESNCDSSNLNECHLKYIVENLEFESKIRKDLSTEVVKKPNGSYKVVVPSLRSRRTVKKVVFNQKLVGNLSRLQNNSDRAKDLQLANINDNIKLIENDYDLSAMDSIVIVDSSANDINLNLPTPESNKGLTIQIKRINSGDNSITLNAGDNLIDGQSFYDLVYQYEAISVISTGTEWLVL